MPRTLLPKVAALALLALAACGAEGAPTPPAAKPAPGLTISGEASVGVSIKG